MKKTILILGVIFLFIGVSINPIVGSISKVIQSINEDLQYTSISGDSGISLITVKVAVRIDVNDRLGGVYCRGEGKNRTVDVGILQGEHGS